MFLNMTCYYHCIIITVYDKKDHAVWLSTHHTEVVYTYTAFKYNNHSFLVLFHNTWIMCNFLQFLKKFIFFQP